MDIEEIREYALRKEQATESLPFDEETPVFKVCGKMFMLLNLTPPFSINLKCDPERAVELREEYEDILPGYHMNKTHWNTVMLEGTIPGKLLAELIDHSYELVVRALPKKLRENFQDGGLNP